MHYELLSPGKAIKSELYCQVVTEKIDWNYSVERAPLSIMTAKGYIRFYTAKTEKIHIVQCPRYITDLALLNRRSMQNFLNGVNSL